MDVALGVNMTIGNARRRQKMGGAWIRNMLIKARPTRRVSTISIPGTGVAFGFVWGSMAQLAILVAIVAASAAAWAHGLSWDVICIIIIVGCCLISLEDLVRSQRVDDC